MLKSIVDSFFTAFSLYSVIPVPKTRWDNQSMRFALCFFPLIGFVTGLLQIGWLYAATSWRVAPGLYAAVAALLPLLISGGIHMDGFIDTCDALSSHAVMEKKLEILKDPHVGAFGVLFCAGQLLLSFGLWQQLYEAPRFLTLACLGYIVSRAFNGLSIATFPCARDSGLVRAFSDSAAKTAATACCAAFAAVPLLGMLLLSPLLGGIATGGALLYFALHKRFCVWEFGGNTGDLAGFLLQNLELLFLIIAAIGGVLA